MILSANSFDFQCSCTWMLDSGPLSLMVQHCKAVSAPSPMYTFLCSMLHLAGDHAAICSGQFYFSNWTSKCNLFRCLGEKKWLPLYLIFHFSFVKSGYKFNGKKKFYWSWNWSFSTISQEKKSSSWYMVELFFQWHSEWLCHILICYSVVSQP